MEEEIQKFRVMERTILQDMKQVNLVVDIRKAIESSKTLKQVKVACVHCLRRIFIDFMENGKLKYYDLSSSSSAALNPQEKLQKWLWTQYIAYRDLLYQMILSSESWSWELALKTLLEFVKTEYYCHSASTGQCFALSTYHGIFDTLLVNNNLNSTTAVEEFDVDLLLFLKQEVFCYADTLYYAIKKCITLLQHTLPGQLAEQTAAADTDKAATTMQQQNKETRIQNMLDLIRMMVLPKSLTLQQASSTTAASAAGQADTLMFWAPVPSSGGEGDAEDEDEDVEDAAVKEKARDEDGDDEGVAIKPTGGKNKKKPNSNNKKAAVTTTTNNFKILQFSEYQRLFSKLWLVYFTTTASCMSLKQHKLLLSNDIPTRILPALTNPLLLSDYLTSCYRYGGLVAVLALESLFTLIIDYHLDYPDFFTSLYQLCQVNIFNSKYSGKFLRLLHMSLKSTNLPAYLIAAFIKRLAYLALHVQANRVSFCLLQITWLLRQHRMVQVLIHRKPIAAVVASTATEESEVKAAVIDQQPAAAREEYNIFQGDTLETCDAFQSSLWELESLERHYIYEIAQLAKALRDPLSTSMGAALPDVEGLCLRHPPSYQSLLEEDVWGTSTSSTMGLMMAMMNKKKRKKEEAALAYQPPHEGIVGGNNQQKKQKMMNKKDLASRVQEVKAKDDNDELLGMIFHCY